MPRHPLPYAFARSSQLLLEAADDDTLTLWHAGTAPSSAWGEVMRKFRVHAVQQLDGPALPQAISAACSARWGCTTSRSVPSTRKRTDECRS